MMSRGDRCLNLMYGMRPSLCDVTLISDDGIEIAAHRVVLSSALHYFHSMFVGSGCPSGASSSTGLVQFKESEQQEISIKNIDGKSLQQIIHWCYTANVDLNEDNVQQLLSAAKMLDAVDIVNSCTEFIRKELQTDNCLGIFEISGMSFLELFVKILIPDHFFCQFLYLMT